MPYADVCVNSPLSRRETAFSYAVPSGMVVRLGQAVRVPFGKRLLQGIVVDLPLVPAVENVRDIDSVIEPEPLVTAPRLELARWLSRYYLCSLYDALALFLPPGFGRKTITLIRACSRPDASPAALLPLQQQILEFLGDGGSLETSVLEKQFGKMPFRQALTGLVRRGLVSREYRLGPVRVKPKTEKFVSLSLTATEVAEVVPSLERRRAFRQKALLEYLLRSGRPLATAELTRHGYTPALVGLLHKMGYLETGTRVVARLPIDYATITPSDHLELTPAQRRAFDAVRTALDDRQAAVFLLQGVTGSGKTEIYLQALAHAVRSRRQAVILVPEIALTSQTIQRFASRFTGRVAVLHSRLSLGEQYDQWQAIRAGEYDVVIGARSALFAPLPAPGLIVIDEEHEWSYKQQDKSPRYHARAAAVEMARRYGAVVLLGSATPDVETRYRAESKVYRLLELPERLTPFAGAAMPAVEIIDLRQELKDGNYGIFSRSLQAAIEQALNLHEQVILFFNRRGDAPFVQCRQCGTVIKCRSCQVAMSYHSAEAVLKCHQCNSKRAVPEVCPHCHSRRIKFLGLGTQRLERETRAAFPRARVLRWDSDSARGRHSHEEIMRQLEAREVDILIGTQVVAKGLHLPGVTLVGVVSADTSLNLPDFRAGERTFQLLTQVAGRAGRGDRPGRVIIQTYSPDHYAIQAMRQLDYAKFYQREIQERRLLHNPPFTQMVNLTFSHIVEEVARREAERLKKQLLLEIAAGGLADTEALGPVPAFWSRLRGHYRWQILLRGTSAHKLIAEIELGEGWAVDVDPLGLS